MNRRTFAAALSAVALFGAACSAGPEPREPGPIDPTEAENPYDVDDARDPDNSPDPVTGDIATETPAATGSS